MRRHKKLVRASFGYFFFLAIAVAIVAVAAVPVSAQGQGRAQVAPSATGQQENGPHLYFFTNEACAPCKRVEPVLLGLAEQGFPITRIDTHTYAAWVEQFRIASTPTVVFVNGNREVLRHSGQVDAQTVAGWFAREGFQPGQNAQAANTNAIANVDAAAAARDAELNARVAGQGARAMSPDVANRPAADISQSVSPYTLTGGANGALSEEEFVSQYNQQRSADRLDSADDTLHYGTRQPGNKVESVAINATVRLRVEDPEGISFATGTVVHCHNGEWLVLTCGHVFRDSNGMGDIKAEYDFANNSPRSAPGKLIYYEASRRDIALVAVNAGVDVQPVAIAPAETTIVRGNGIFSVGCDHGESPTIRRSSIKNQALYNGVSKYDIYGRPVDGRSGGGLFTKDGQLIGVCNAAAVEFDEGIYTAIDTVYWQLETAGLEHLFVPGNAQNAVASAINGTGANSLSVQPASEFAPLSQIGSINPPNKSVNNSENNGAAGSDSYAQQNGIMAYGNANSGLPDDQVAATPRESFRNVENPSADSGTIRGPVRNVGWDSESPVAATSNAPRNEMLPADDMEVIVIIRSRVEPANTQAITLPNPSDKLLRYLENVGNEQTDNRSIDMARLRLPVQRTRFR